MRTVYVHTTPEGKRYVGATHRKPEYRFNKGRGYKYQFFYQAILKFGWENITHQLYEVDTEEELKYLEKYLISYYDTTNPEKGYNITKGDSTQDHGMDHPEYGKGEIYSQYKESYHKYFTSDKGKEKYKLARQRWLDTEKGKEKYKLARQRWLDTEKGKEYYKKYRMSEKNKLAHRRWYEKKKKQMKNE